MAAFSLSLPRTLKGTYSTCIASKSSHDTAAYCTAPVYGEGGTRNCQGT